MDSFSKEQRSQWNVQVVYVYVSVSVEVSVSVSAILRQEQPNRSVIISITGLLATVRTVPKQVVEEKEGKKTGKDSMKEFWVSILFY